MLLDLLYKLDSADRHRRVIETLESRTLHRSLQGKLIEVRIEA